MIRKEAGQICDVTRQRPLESEQSGYSVKTLPEMPRLQFSILIVTLQKIKGDGLKGYPREWATRGRGKQDSLGNTWGIEVAGCCDLLV